jgi:hypothetical protein
MTQTKEEKAAYKKMYSQSEKGKATIAKYEQSEKRKAYKIKYEQTEKRKLYNTNYELTDERHKKRTINRWKRLGLIHNNYEELYDEYMECNSCDICNNIFTNGYDRCMDHCHTSGAFRQFLCRDCNLNDKWMEIYFAGFFD